jgi:hypothetical protein
MVGVHALLLAFLDVVHPGMGGIFLDRSKRGTELVVHLASKQQRVGECRDGGNAAVSGGKGKGWYIGEVKSLGILLT